MTIDYRLCNVLLADGTRFEEQPDLYVHTTPTIKGDEGGARLDPLCRRYDFATYLNAFSCAKWHRYTTVENVWLHLVVRGSFELALTGYEVVLQKPKRVVYAREAHDHEDYVTLDVCYPDTDAVLLAFELVTSAPLDLAQAYFYTKIDEEALRNVELAVATTTFRKEDFIVPNMHLFEEQVLGCNEPVSDHFTLHVVDNGRTLDVAALEAEHERVHVHPNPNVGGAGGFARGMIEAMEQTPKATHVLLMDDDVQIHPEAIKRTYNLLALLRPEFDKHFVSGATLYLEQPNLFREDVGFINGRGEYQATKQPGFDDDPFDVSHIDACVTLETWESYQANRYAAWWYCCIPISTVEEKGLALPLFIRGDDAEYSNRAAEGFITMNGICLWHLSRAGVFRPAMERYYPIRNALITKAASGIYGNVDFVSILHHFFSLDLKTFNYSSADLCLKGFEDYLRGPEYIKYLKTDANNQALAAKNEKLVPVEELDDELLKEASFNHMQLPTEYEPRGLATRAFDFLTFNGQRGPEQLSRGGLGVIAYDGWYYPANTIRGKDALLAVTTDGTQAVLRKKDRTRFEALTKRYQQLMKDYQKRGEEVHASWAAAREELTSVQFWKWYLAEQGEQTEVSGVSE